jgi:uncharacterized protein
LLTFMFIWNMFGSLILMPSLAVFLIKPRDAGGAAEVGVPKASAPVAH